MTLSKYADQATVGGKSGTGSIVKSKQYSRGLRLRSAAASWAGVGIPKQKDDNRATVTVPAGFPREWAALDLGYDGSRHVGAHDQRRIFRF